MGVIDSGSGSLTGIDSEPVSNVVREAVVVWDGAMMTCFFFLLIHVSARGGCDRFFSFLVCFLSVHDVFKDGSGTCNILSVIANSFVQWLHGSTSVL
jgi:hypothetical protein